jgi:hypothetical protein
VIFLNVLFNLRFPSLEVPLWYVIPSVDVVMILGGFVLVGSQGWRVPKAVHVVLVVLIVLARLLRFGDGIQDRYYAQRFTLYDLALLPEGIRFAHSALPAWKFYPLLLVVGAALLILPLAASRALRLAEAYLFDWKRAPLVGALAVFAFGIGLVLPREVRHQKLFTGGYGTSIGPRMRREVSFLFGVWVDREKWRSAIGRADQELSRTPSDLALLGRRNVHLILVESYGEVAVERPDFVTAITPSFRALETELGARGFSVASGKMVSTTFGGRSWLAHATLATTVPVTDQLAFDTVHASKPKTMAGFFRAAGYRTVLVAPGVTRPGSRGDLYRFDKNYYYADFEYEGPAFAWATLPDQFALDFVRRRELTSTQPLFIQYVLVSSHAPWSETPTIVEDWSRLGNGAIFDIQPVLRFPIVWPNFENAHEAYIRSIVYEFEVIRRFVVEFIQDDALVIVLGDHQPVVEVSGDERNKRVPIHVFSREKALVEPFLARGYVPGMWPSGAKEARGMESFLFDLLRDFSTTEAPRGR